MLQRSTGPAGTSWWCQSCIYCLPKGLLFDLWSSSALVSNTYVYSSLLILIIEFIRDTILVSSTRITKGNTLMPVLVFVLIPLLRQLSTMISTWFLTQRSRERASHASTRCCMTRLGSRCLSWSFWRTGRPICMRAPTNLWVYAHQLTMLIGHQGGAQHYSLR